MLGSRLSLLAMRRHVLFPQRGCCIPLDRVEQSLTEQPTACHQPCKQKVEGSFLFQVSSSLRKSIHQHGGKRGWGLVRLPMQIAYLLGLPWPPYQMPYRQNFSLIQDAKFSTNSYHAGNDHTSCNISFCPPCASLYVENFEEHPWALQLTARASLSFAAQQT